MLLANNYPLFAYLFWTLSFTSETPIINSHDSTSADRRLPLCACPLGKLSRGRALLLHAASGITPLLLSSKAPHQHTIRVLSAWTNGISN